MADDEKRLEEKTVLFGGGSDEKPAGLKPPYLLIVDGPHKGARFPLQEGANVLGRLDECHVILDDQSVSRKHAEVTLAPQGWTLQDLQSKNGTYVNGALIQEAVVMGHKDLVRVGIYTLRLITQEISPEEEMDIPPQDVDEWGTVMVGEGGKEGGGETARFGVGEAAPVLKDSQGREITAPHSPLEEEEGAGDKKGLVPLKEKGSWLPKARLWILLAILFVTLLGGGLYFYWDNILVSKEDKKSKGPPVALQPFEPQAIPLGPPEPVKPQTVPIFLDCVANPFPAIVRFEEKEIGKTPLKVNIELVPNKDYEIEATFDMPELQDKYTDRLHFTVTPEQSMVPLLFRAPLGTLKVTSLPRDAALYLEAYYEYNKFQAKPVKLTNPVLNKPIYVPFGRYIVELRQAKQVGEPSNLVEDISFRREFVLREEQPTFVLDVNETSLQQFPAEIRSSPAGADVFIDQQKVGQTPYVGTLPLGKHTLTLRKEGYFDASQEMMTDLNTPFKTEMTLKTTAAGEKINQAKAYQRQGLYQEAIQSLSDVFALNPAPREMAEARYLLGSVFLQLKDYSKAQGYFEQAKENEDFKYLAKLGLVDVLALQQQTGQALIPLVEVLLNAKDENILKQAYALLRKTSPLRSVVYIQSDPPGAEVYLNEKKITQVTPLLLHELGLGSYRIRLERAGYQPLSLTVNLSINEFNPVLAKLKPISQ